VGALASQVDAANYFVRDYAAAPNAPGTSWETAFSKLQDALSAAKGSSGADFIQIAVPATGSAWKAGSTVYGAWGGWLGTTGGQPAQLSTFKVDGATSAIRLLGGFPATATTANPGFDPLNNHVVLSGDLSGNDTAWAGLEDDATNDENAYHVMTIVEVFNTSIIDELTIERGNCAELIGPQLPDETPGSRGGGGLLVTSTPVAPSRGETPVTMTIAQPYIQNCIIQLNAGAKGGGLLATRQTAFVSGETLPTVHLRNCTVRGNRCNEYGAGLRMNNGHLDFAATLIVANDATAPWGGGVFLSSSALVGFAYKRCDATLRHCTIAQNKSSGDSWADLGWDSLSSDSQITLTSTILSTKLANGVSSDVVTQRGGGGEVGRGEATVTKCAITIGHPDWDHPHVAEAYDVVDPYFVNAGPGVALFARDYHVHRCSPIRDLGEVNSNDLLVDLTDVDHDGNLDEKLPDRVWAARVQDSDGVPGARTDVGAFEHSDSQCPGDINFDGVVNALDVGLLLGNWTYTELPVPEGTNPSWCDIASPGLVPQCMCADFNHDVRIDASDLGVLLGAWGACVSGSMNGMGNGMSGENGGESASEESAETVVTPTDLAELFNFGSTEDFADWLGTLAPSVRAEILSLLGGG